MKEKYPNGYQAKVYYWKGQLNNGVVHCDPDLIRKALAKLNYFAPKHAAWLEARELKFDVDQDIDPAGGYGLYSHI
jgi:hypothetical protein